MSNPIKHHYVPRRFCDADRMLWTYDKEKKQIYRGPPASQARGTHFYSFKGDDGNRTAIIELKFLRKIDADGCIAIQRILNRETLTSEQSKVHACVAFTWETGKCTVSSIGRASDS
jgi:hypothetical protein